MSTAIIYVFSGTGNTMKVSRAFADSLNGQDVETSVFKITADMSEIPNPNLYDYVGIAYPIHGFNAPQLVLEFAKELPTRDKKAVKKKVFILKTSGEPLSINNISSVKLKGILARKGYDITNEYHYVMPYNMIFRHDDGMAAKMWDAAKGLIPINAEEVLSEDKHLLKRIPFGGIIAGLFRIEHCAMKVNGRFFKVDEDVCINCGKCARDCPENNIKIEDGKFVFGRECIMCARCSCTCPVNAISIGILNGWKVNGAYDFNKTPCNQQGRHSGYCQRSYERYFDNAEKKIAEWGRKFETNEVK